VAFFLKRIGSNLLERQFLLSAVAFLPMKNREEKATAANQGYLRKFFAFLET